MQSASFQAKKAYYAKVRRSNYLASLRLAGFEVSPEDANRPLPTRESVINRYRPKAD